MAGIGSMGEEFGKWIDQLLQPLVSSIPVFLKDTGDTISKIHHTPWYTSSSWLTCDVVGLYPSIPHDFAIQYLYQHLTCHSSYSVQLIHFIVLGVEFLLHHNYFFYNGQFFLQRCGASMGARFSPSLANIFMAALGG